MPPFFESSGLVEFEIVPTVAAVFLVEMIQYRSVDGGEFLQTSRSPEAEHRPLSSSQRQMGVLNTVVEPVA